MVSAAVLWAKSGVGFGMDLVAIVVKLLRIVASRKAEQQEEIALAAHEPVEGIGTPEGGVRKTGTGAGIISRTYMRAGAAAMDY